MPKNRSKAEEAARNKEIRELQTEYNKLRKTANQRMYRLEKLSENPEYKPVLGYAYKNAAYDIKALGAKNERRFPGDIGRMSATETDIRKLKAYINTAKEFLSSASSTKRGIDRVYAQRAATLNAKYAKEGVDLNFTADDMKTFFDSAAWKRLDAKNSYDVAFRMVAKIQQEPESILADIKRGRDTHHKIEFTTLKDVKDLDLSKDISRSDIKVFEKLAEMYLHK